MRNEKGQFVKGHLSIGGFKKGHQINLGRISSPKIIIKCLSCGGKSLDYRCNERKFCSRKCSGVINSGANHPAWKNGITIVLKGIRGSREYLRWKNTIKNRDK